MQERSEHLEIVKATMEHIAEVSRLFDLYRQFYECEPDLELATQFITARIELEESDIFVAVDGASASGFVQLYPSFCSVDAVRIYILYDIYVDADKRGTGLGERLMNQATAWAKANGAARLDLLTAHDNVIGQHLYEKLGYKKVLEDFYAYSLQVE
jgi:ribosomal protein S18 acetylase RimI-like enzyme